MRAFNAVMQVSEARHDDNFLIRLLFLNQHALYIAMHDRRQQ